MRCAIGTWRKRGSCSILAHKNITFFFSQEHTQVFLWSAYGGKMEVHDHSQKLRPMILFNGNGHSLFQRSVQMIMIRSASWILNNPALFETGYLRTHDTTTFRNRKKKANCLVSEIWDWFKLCFWFQKRDNPRLDGKYHTSYKRMFVNKLRKEK